MDNHAKLELSIDLTNKDQVAAFANLFLALAGQTSTTIVVENSSEQTAKEEKKSMLPNKPAAEPVEQSKEEPKVSSKPTEVNADAVSDSPEIKVEDVRSMLQKKVSNHRDSIKEKLTSLGAANVTALDSSKYKEFMDFLNSLK